MRGMKHHAGDNTGLKPRCMWPLLLVSVNEEVQKNK